MKNLLLLLSININILLLYSINTTKQEYNFAKECNAFKYEVLQEYDQYYNAVEQILDMSYPHDDNFYLDVIMEMDFWQQYMDSKEKIDSLYLTQL